MRFQDDCASFFMLNKNCPKLGKFVNAQNIQALKCPSFFLEKCPKCPNYLPVPPYIKKKSPTNLFIM